jgi:hypothetical protein
MVPAQPDAGHVLSLLSQLPDDQQQIVRNVIGLGPPPQAVVGPLWLLVVGAFVVLLVGGAGAVVALNLTSHDTKDLLPLVTAAVGVLAGLLAPSPVAKGIGG